MESKRAVPTFNSVAAEIGELVTEKNQCYGDSFAKCGEFLRLLYPTGLEPAKYGDALSMVRIFDKQMRIATRKDAFGESPYNDIAGYGLLGATADAKAALFHTPLAPEEVKAINSSISPPSLCGTCIRQGCPVDCAEHTTECVNYLAPTEEAAQVEKAEFSFSFPAAEKFMGQIPLDYVSKLREEVQEVATAMNHRDYVIELMDVIHAAETAIRTAAATHGLDIQDLADHVVAKNRQRNYYTKG